MLNLRGRRARAVPDAAVPAQADLDGFLAAARCSFVSVQAAWDRADLQALSRLACRPLLDDLRCQLAERGATAQRTEVLSLSARLLSLDDLREGQIAAIEYSGWIREHGQTSAPRPFRELWMLARANGSDERWQLARVQALS